MKHINNTLLAILVIALSAAYQVHCAIRGFDLTDEGYLMTIYQWFATEPYYAQGAGGYPLTAWLGAQLNNLGGGILAMRLWGVALVVLTEIGIYCYLRRRFNNTMVLMGLLLQSIMVAQDPKPFGYNTLTACVGLLALVALMEGALRNRYWLLLVSGVLLGVNAFVRLPNVTGLGFLLIPLLACFQDRSNWGLRRSSVQIATVLAGFVVAIMATWQLMVHIGADGQVRDLIASITGQLGGNSTHGSGSMLSKYAGNYIMALWFVMIYMIAAVVSAYSLRSRQWWLMLIGFFVAFMALYQNAYMRGNMLGDNLLALLNGIGLAGTCCYIIKDTRRRTIAAGAILSSLIFPLGSDGGFQTMWVGTWMLLPVGLSGAYQLLQQAVASRSSVKLVLTTQAAGDGSPASRGLLNMEADYLRQGFIVALIMLAATALIKVEHKSYYDPGDRFKKTATIHSPMAQGIYTSQKRADIVNPLLDTLAQYVKAGDEILVYDTSPLLYYLTQTRPFAGVSWPCVFYGQTYVDKFAEAEKKAHQMPLVVMQYFYASNDWTEVFPSYYLLSVEGGEKDDGFFSSKEMKLNIRRFLKEHHYKTVWSNNYYEILLPE